MEKGDAKKPDNDKPVEGMFHEARFSNVSLDDAALERFEFREEIGGVYAAKLETSQMLVLGGYGLEDKWLFAKHLAHSLRVRFNRSIPVKRWHPALAPQGFDDALRRFSSEIIVLFPEVRPHHFGYDLARLHDEVRQHDEKDQKLYIILTTDSRREDWGVEEALGEEIWCDLKTQDIYPPDFLNHVLDLELQDGPEIAWPAPYSARCVAESLRMPSRVRSFAFLVKARQDRNDPVDKDWIEETLQQLSGDGAEISRWYQKLDKRPQLLALGLAMLDGFFRDQALAVLEFLSAKVWRGNFPQLEAFAARELPILGAYFRETAEGNGHPQITCLSDRHRREILNAAWKCYPNELKAALTVLAEIAAGSGGFGGPVGFPRDRRQTGEKKGESKQKSDAATDKNDDNNRNERAPGGPEDLFAGWLPPGHARNLFGSPERIQQVQWAVSATLSEVGKMIPFEEVENTLLYLAKGDRFAFWSVAAAALALWRKLEAEEDAKQLGLAEKRVNFLCDTLERWLKEAFALQREYPEHSVHVRATVALTVSYAALFDPPSILSKRLRDLLENISRDPQARIFVRRHTIPWITALHLGQEEVRAFLQDTIGQEDEFHSRFGLAEGLATACSLSVQRENALAILEQWFKEGLRAPRQRKWVPPARNRLVVAVLAYCWIMSDDELDGESFSRAEFLSRLDRVLKNDKEIRELAVNTFKFQFSRNLEGFELGLLRRMTSQELDSLADTLKDLHDQERKKQQDYGLEPDPKKRRSLTDVEKAMEGWLLDRSCKAAERLALRVLIKISEDPVEQEDRRIRAEAIWKAAHAFRGKFRMFFTKIKNPTAWNHAWQEAANRIAVLRRDKLRDPLFLTPVLRRVSVFVATCFSPRDRPIAQIYFAELLRHWQSSVANMRKPRAELGAIFNRYEGNADLDRIVGHLTLSVWLFRYRWPLMGVNGLLLADLWINIWAYWG